MSRDTSVLCSVLKAAIEPLEAAHTPGISYRVVCTERTAKEQQAEYAKGRTIPGVPKVTNCDGVEKKSPHQRTDFHGENAVHALDFGAFSSDGKYLAQAGFYNPLVARAVALGLVSGGTWHQQDRPHVQCKPSFETKE